MMMEEKERILLLTIIRDILQNEIIFLQILLLYNYKDTSPRLDNKF